MNLTTRLDTTGQVVSCFAKWNWDFTRTKVTGECNKCTLILLFMPQYLSVFHFLQVVVYCNFKTLGYVFSFCVEI